MNPNTMTLQECCSFLSVPPTLDAIAGALPESWTLDYVRERFVEGNKWFASAYRALLKDKLGERVCAEADTEILSRARLAVACRMAEQSKE